METKKPGNRRKGKGGWSESSSPHFPALFFLLVLIVTAASAFDPQAEGKKPGKEGIRVRRSNNEHIVKDCMYVASEEGHFYYKATGEEGVTVCGVYIMGDPDKLVQIHFDYLDVPCSTGGLLAFVDGWELSGGYFPPPVSEVSLSERVVEFCGLSPPKRVFTSTQNAALIQYRIPKKGRGFSFRVKFIKNPTPCNVLVEGSREVFTLRNYGKASNCSLTALFPVAVSVLSLDIGVEDLKPILRSDIPIGRGSMVRRPPRFETGTVHRCHEKELSDYLLIGGGEDLGLSNLSTLDTICGVDSTPGHVSETIVCGVSTVRLVSTGSFENSVTLQFRQATEDDVGLNAFACPQI